MLGLLPLLLRLFLGSFFVVSALGKVSRPDLFAEAVRGYELLPDPWVAFMALGLPWLEAVTGLALALGWCWRGALVWIGLCLVSFILALASAWWRGLDISCGCMGQGGASRGALALLRQLGLDLILLGIVIGLLWPRRRAPCP